MARTVEDAVHVFKAIIGSDDLDPVTQKSRKFDDVDWETCLNMSAFKGKRIGISRSIFEKKI